VLLLSVRAATREDNFPGVGLNESRDALAGGVHVTGDFLSEAIRARRIAPLLGQERRHGLNDLRRNARRGVVVK
jgi:hypothetical protein